MDDILRRLGVVESLVAETREDVSAIKATVPHLATKADIHATGADINSVRAEINLVRADMNFVRADICALETRIIRWIIGTTIAAASVAFTIAKFVNQVAASREIRRLPFIESSDRSRHPKEMAHTMSHTAADIPTGWTAGPQPVPDCLHSGQSRLRPAGHHSSRVAIDQR